MALGPQVGSVERNPTFFVPLANGAGSPIFRGAEGGLHCDYGIPARGR